MDYKSGRTKKFVALFLIVLLVALPVWARKKAEPPHGPHEQYGAIATVVQKDIPYVTGVPGAGKLKLDVYSNPHEGLWPVLVMIHGGAWIKGTKSYDNKVFICQYMAHNGYVVFTIDYRLAPVFKLKTQAEDSMAAVIWVKQHAREYGGDSTRIGVMGGSAGGHLAALVAWASDDPYFVPTGKASSSVDSDVLVAGLYYPVLDVDRTLKEDTKGLGTLARLLLVGKVDGPYKKAMQHLSPINHVNSKTPPTIFLTGDADGLKLYPQSVKLTQMLKDAGVDAELYTAAGKDHGFTWQYWEPETLGSVEALVKFFDKYLKK